MHLNPKTVSDLETSEIWNFAILWITSNQAESRNVSNLFMIWSILIIGFPTWVHSFLFLIVYFKIVRIAFFSIFKKFQFSCLLDKIDQNQGSNTKFVVRTLWFFNPTLMLLPWETGVQLQIWMVFLMKAHFQTCRWEVQKWRNRIFIYRALEFRIYPFFMAEPEARGIKGSIF